MTDKEFFSSYGISFEGESKVDYDVSQLVQMLVHAKSKEEKLVLPETIGEKVLEDFKKFIEMYKEAFTNTKKGLKHDWHCGYSLMSNDEKTLYIFSFASAGTPILINGVVNKKKQIFILPENKALDADSSLGLGAGPGTIWLSLKENEIHDVCTVVKIKFNEQIKLYEGTGAPITVN